MIWEYNAVALTLALICAVVSLSIRDVMASAIVFGAYSFLMCIVWNAMGAADVAFTEAAVGAGVSTVFFIATIYRTTRISNYTKKDLFVKSLTSIVVSIMGLALIAVITDFSKWGNLDSPVNTYVGAYYITHALEDTGVPNIVTTVLADYRGFDTMFETCVVFVACIAIYSILRRSKEETKASKKRVNFVAYDSLILKVCTRIMVPFMQLFALYVLAHGHHSPGGGFQAGVILGASIILLSMSFDVQTALSYLNEKKMLAFSAFGVLIYSGIGLLCLFLGGNFLDYGVLHKVLPYTDAIMARSHAMLGVETGVALTVMAAMYGIYLSLATDGKFDQGL
jgi:multicomponent Na+:H+ antiporter subunit B